MSKTSKTGKRPAAPKVKRPKRGSAEKQPSAEVAAVLVNPTATRARPAAFDHPSVVLARLTQQQRETETYRRSMWSVAGPSRARPRA